MSHRRVPRVDETFLDRKGSDPLMSALMSAVTEKISHRRVPRVDETFLDRKGSDPLMSALNVRQRIESMFRTDDWPEAWRTSVLPLWQKIALYECLEYLTHQLSKHGMDFSPGDKTFMVLRDALTTFSVSQVYGAICRAAKNAAAYYMEQSSNISLRQAANTVVGRIQSFVEHARAEKWDVMRYRRDFNCPPSMVSNVLFDAVLKIGSDGFDLVPHEIESATI
jgi:hypothetical protein